MVCEHCGNVLKDGAVVCTQCGAQVASPRRADSGLASRRQGRPDRPQGPRTGSVMPEESYPQAELPPARHRSPSRSESDRGAYRVPSQAPGKVRSLDRKRRGKKGAVHRVMINWALLWTVVLVLIILAVGGTAVFLRFTAQGQLILARMGREANATAMWTYGQELLDQGYVDRSVSVFEQAYEMEPEREDIYTRLLQLADAYEAAGRPGDAERVYTKLYTDIAPEDAFVYRQVARLMESQGRQMELAAFLKLAFEKTGDTSFRRQREELLPSSPTASKEAGPIKYEQDVELLSAEDYEIYYIFGDDGILPEDGELYTTPIHLDEGTHIIRAVAVSSNLISDEMRIQYSITLPRPSAPYASLAPGPYERRQRLWLKYLETEDEKLLEQQRTRTDHENAILAKLKDITIYYTVDSQTPTSNSPIYTGEPFLLPLGPSTVKAVAVNGYGKVSNVMERTYNVKKPFKLYFSEADNFADFTIAETSREAFEKRFGAPMEAAPIQDNAVGSDAVKLTYSWGEARFYMTDKGYMLYAVETSSPSAVGPRKTKIGMSETDVTELFRDMGQEHNQDGSRSIYYDAQNRKYAMMYHLDAFNDRIDYIYYRADNGVVTLSYYLNNSRVVKMAIRCDFN